ncbi:MAG: Flp family type IVb pilin [Rickettsiales bacterium]|nr:Flp family type IVb pilin [Rickettsiales bacterium]
MLDKLLQLLDSESGATAIEYGLIAALISVSAIIGMTATGEAVRSRFSVIAVQMVQAR